MSDDKTLKEREEEGKQVIREMFGDAFLDTMESNAGDSPFGPQPKYSFGNAFADFWGRSGIDRKTRSLITIAFLIAQRLPNELQNHVKGALNNGCTLEEINEVLLQAIPYCGFPTASAARKAAENAVRQYQQQDPVKPA